MRKIFNTSNLLLLGIAVAAAGLLYMGMLWHCAHKSRSVVTNNFGIEATSAV